MNKIDLELEYCLNYKQGNVTTSVFKLGKELNAEEIQKVLKENIEGFDISKTKLTRL